MVSPFPGMDPFLEHPDIFPDLHDRFVVHLSEVLQQRLPQPYYARLGRRLWVEISERYIGPAVALLLRKKPARPSDGAVVLGGRSRAVVVTIPHDERKETLVEIRTRDKRGGRLVTSIELLSLTNKTPGEHGRDLYVRKQQELVESSKTHLVEIDLLRAGEHSTAVSLERALEKTGPFDYHVCIHCFDRWEDFFIYPILLTEALPEIPIPLLPGDQPVLVDLQAIVSHCYSTAHYERDLLYDSADLVPPLSAGRMKWVKRLLREKRAGK